jgi:hypothetical protein
MLAALCRDCCVPSVYESISLISQIDVAVYSSCFAAAAAAVGAYFFQSPDCLLRLGI